MSSSNPAYDYIVVGGGIAGVVIASRLSHYLPTAKVALLEAGPNAVNHPHVTNPNAAPLILVGKELVVDYSTTPQNNLNGRQIFNPAGRMLSGSSGTNFGLWMRASSTDYAIVAERAGHDRFTFEKLLPYFKRIETYWDKDADQNIHGFNGPVHTVGGREYPLRNIVLESAAKLGHRHNVNSTAGDPTGFSDVTQCYRATSDSSSERQHSAQVYDLSKVHLLCDSAVARVHFDPSNSVKRIELVSGQFLDVSKEVIVCCGAQKSPQMLMLSGIGPSQELSRHGISPIVDNPGVGRNLFDHTQITQFFKLKHPENGYCLPFQGKWKAEYGQGLPWEFNAFINVPPAEISPMLSADHLSGVEDGTHPHLQPKRCHIMCIPWYFPILATPEYNSIINPTDGSHIAFTAVDLLPISRGTITLQSSSPKDEPVIDPLYMSTNTDRFLLRRGIRENLRLIETEPLANEIEGETPPADPAFPALTAKSTDEEIDARVRGFAGTIAHPMGTCALGTVLDSDFRVKGVQGLRVCDASVFPEPIGAMPSCTIYALAELCADLVAGRA